MPHASDRQQPFTAETEARIRDALRSIVRALLEVAIQLSRLADKAERPDMPLYLAPARSLKHVDRMLVVLASGAGAARQDALLGTVNRLAVCRGYLHEVSLTVAHELGRQLGRGIDPNEPAPAVALEPSPEASQIVGERIESLCDLLEEAYRLTGTTAHITGRELEFVVRAAAVTSREGASELEAWIRTRRAVVPDASDDPLRLVYVSTGEPKLGAMLRSANNWTLLREELDVAVVLPNPERGTREGSLGIAATKGESSP